MSRTKHLAAPAPVSSAVVSAGTLLEEIGRISVEVTRQAHEVMRGWEQNLADPLFRPAAANLAAYLALRRQDLSAIQPALAMLGLSSLGRSESHVAANLQAVCAALARIAGRAAPAHPSADTWSEGEWLLGLRKRDLFAVEGAAPGIMVTLPSEAAADPVLADRLVTHGMTCARINCAHDDAAAWQAMIAHVRNAARAQGRACRILMDLGGPKCRIETVMPAKPDRLHIGDRLRLVASPDPAPDSLSGPLPSITISFPQVLDRLAPGGAVWINDGKLRCRILDRCPGGWLLEVTGARAKGERLRPEKGFNLPGVDLGLSPLSAEDLRDLDFVAAHADLIGFSFVQRPDDIRLLDAELEKRLGGRDLPSLVLKIETALAVHNLPRLIVQAAGKRPCAVMIARGDLAVDIGFDRLAEIQEEMLWLCQAASVPVVWATQVLDDLVRDGLPSRAEATDAAMAQRAECVMLNKGPYLVEAMSFLNDVIRRMDRHQSKKAARLGPLQSWPLDELALPPV